MFLTGIYTYLLPFCPRIVVFNLAGIIFSFYLNMADDSKYSILCIPSKKDGLQLEFDEF